MYLASQRKEFILKTLAEHGAARTIALAKQMKVTDETVRNDLINLEKRGFLKRVHGGALALTHKSLHEDIVTQDDVSIRIAKKTVQNIPASVVMFIDSSTMGYQICNHINSKDTHVVSNNPTLLTRLEGIPNLSFYCTGGHFDREALVYVGQDAAKAAAFVVDALDGVSRVTQGVGMSLGAMVAQTKLFFSGDFKGAQIEWQTLPERGQAAAVDYKRKLDARVTVEGLIGAAVSGAMATGNQG